MPNNGESLMEGNTKQRLADLIEDKYAMEIWLSIDNEAFCYYFFPYGEAVIEV